MRLYSSTDSTYKISKMAVMEWISGKMNASAIDTDYDAQCWLCCLALHTGPIVV
jgi:hypothetical protein